MISTLPNLPTNTGLRSDPPSKPGPRFGQMLPDFPFRDQNTKPPGLPGPLPDFPSRDQNTKPPGRPGPLPDFPFRDQNTKPPGLPGPLPDFQSRDQNTKPTDIISISVPPNANGTLNPGDREFGPQNKVLGVQDTSYVTP